MRLHLALALISVVAAVPQPVLDALEVRAADPTIDTFVLDERYLIERDPLALEKRDATGRCPDGQTSVSNGVIGTPNGCGPGKFGGLVPELWFNSCCNAHDGCYGDCSQSKDTCDSTFYDCMKSTCDSTYNRFSGNWLECRATAGVYYGAVKVAGGSAFRSNTEDHCNCV